MIKKTSLFFVLLGSLWASEKSLISYSNELVSNGKNVVFIFGTKTCAYCDLLKKDIDTNKKIKALIDGKVSVYYIPLDNGEAIEYTIGDGKEKKKTTNLSLKMGFGSKYTPTVVMFDENWKKIITSPGYPPPPLFSAYLEYLVNDLHESEDFQKYLEKKGIL